MKIYCIGFYSSNIEGTPRFAAESGNGVYCTVLEGVRTAVNERTEVIAVNCSPIVATQKFAKEKGRSYQKNGINFVLRPSLSGYKFIRFFDIKILMQRWLYHYLDNRVKNDDVIIVYHSLGYLNVIKKIVKKNKCKLIVNVEEFYSDAAQKPNAKKRKKEERYFSQAQGFFLSTELLAGESCFLGKPFCVVYGDYRPAIVERRLVDEKVHLVYSGTLSTVKGGARNAITCLLYLPKNYVLHILSQEKPNEILSLSESLGLKSQVIFDGFLKGDEFTKKISDYSIGLAVQGTSNTLNKSSFPSKIINYLKCGLAVVSTPSESVLCSAVRDGIFISETDAPVDIAQAVLKATNALNRFHKDFGIDRLRLSFENGVKSVISKVTL